MASVREAALHVVRGLCAGRVLFRRARTHDRRARIARSSSVGRNRLYVASDIIGAPRRHPRCRGARGRDMAVLHGPQASVQRRGRQRYRARRSPTSTGTWKMPKRAVIPTLCSRRSTSSRASRPRVSPRVENGMPATRIPELTDESCAASRHPHLRGAAARPCTPVWWARLPLRAGPGPRRGGHRQRVPLSRPHP